MISERQKIYVQELLFAWISETNMFWSLYIDSFRSVSSSFLHFKPHEKYKTCPKTQWGLNEKKLQVRFDFKERLQNLLFFCFFFVFLNSHHLMLLELFQWSCNVFKWNWFLPEGFKNSSTIMFGLDACLQLFFNRVAYSCLILWVTSQSYFLVIRSNIFSWIYQNTVNVIGICK